MNRPLRTTSRFGYEIPNYLTPEEAKRIRKDKSDMYVQTKFTRVPITYVEDISGTYGKAKIYTDETGVIYLRSYDTIVCSIYKYYDNNAYWWIFERYWSDWSRTTANHITAFLQKFGLSTVNKKDWLNTPMYEPIIKWIKEV